MNEERIKEIILWITIPIWFLPFIIYYLYDWSRHQEDYLKCKFYEHCNSYKRGNLCDNDGAKHYYGSGSPAGCYRSLVEQGKESKFWKD